MYRVSDEQSVDSEYKATLTRMMFVTISVNMAEVMPSPRDIVYV